jgi:hypothetical protein
MANTQLPTTVPQLNQQIPDSVLEFIRAPLTGDLSDVPGIGQGVIIKLRTGRIKIYNTVELLGHFIVMRNNIRRFDKFLESKLISGRSRQLILHSMVQLYERYFPHILE